MGLPLLRRPFGVCDVNGKVISVLVKIIGPATILLSKIDKGEVIDVLGPLGAGFDISHHDTEYLLVAGGIGIAPLLLTARTLLNENQKAALFFGGATKNDLPALEDFEKLGINVIPSTEDGSKGHKGLITTPLIDSLKKRNFNNPIILACGPPAMLKAVADIALQVKVPCQVSLETVMACGVGGCLGCVTEVIQENKNDLGAPCYERICREGPVFDSRKVVWKESGNG